MSKKDTNVNRGIKAQKTQKGERGYQGEQKKDTNINSQSQHAKPTHLSVYICIIFFYTPPNTPFPPFVFFFDVPLSPCLHLYLSFFAPLECYICIPLSPAVSFFFPPFVYICGLGCRFTWNVTFVNKDIHL